MEHLRWSVVVTETLTWHGWRPASKMSYSGKLQWRRRDSSDTGPLDPDMEGGHNGGAGHWSCSTGSGWGYTGLTAVSSGNWGSCSSSSGLSGGLWRLRWLRLQSLLLSPEVGAWLSSHWEQEWLLWHPGNRDGRRVLRHRGGLRWSSRLWVSAGKRQSLGAALVIIRGSWAGWVIQRAASVLAQSATHSAVFELAISGAQKLRLFKTDRYSSLNRSFQHEQKF